MADEGVEEKGLKRTQRIAIFYFLFALFVGLPTWYWTTSAVKHQLNTDGIRRITTSPLNLDLTVNCLIEEASLKGQLDEIFKKQPPFEIRDDGAQLKLKLEPCLVKDDKLNPDNIQAIKEGPWIVLTKTGREEIVSTESGFYVHVNEKGLQNSVKRLGEILCYKEQLHDPKLHNQFSVFVILNRFKSRPDLLKTFDTIHNLVQTGIDQFSAEVNDFLKVSVDTRLIQADRPVKQHYTDHDLTSLVKDYNFDRKSFLDNEMVNAYNLVLLLDNEVGNSTLAKVDTMLVPKWGNFYKLNCPLDSQCTKDFFKEKFARSIERLSGFKSDPNSRQSLVLTYLAKLSWKLNHLSTTYSKISRSLASLLKSIKKNENLVVSQTVCNFVQSSIDKFNQALKNLKEGHDVSTNIHTVMKLLDEAGKFAKKSFYDSSLLNLLYFPDDQKIGIYLPLYAPIVIPVVSAIFKIVKNRLKKTPAKPKAE